MRISVAGYKEDEIGRYHNYHGSKAGTGFFNLKNKM
jgi:hypothetical protein